MSAKQKLIWVFYETPIFHIGPVWIPAPSLLIVSPQNVFWEQEAAILRNCFTLLV